MRTYIAISNEVQIIGKIKHNNDNIVRRFISKTDLQNERLIIRLINYMYVTLILYINSEMSCNF